MANPVKKDIRNRSDLEFLLSEFYNELLIIAEMRHIFIDVAKIDMGEHLSTIVDFWEQVLFHTSDYRKNVMKIHLDLDEKAKLSGTRFNTWLQTFENTVDAHFEGENADKIKTRALSIATIMQAKLQGF